MRITHVIPALTKGGGERVMVTLANAAAATGHDVSVVAAVPVDPTLLQDDLDPAVRLHFVMGGGGKLGRYLGLVPWIARNWHWLGIQDIVHCHLTFGALFGSIVRARRWLSNRSTPRVVETFHAVGMPIRPWQRALSARLARHRDGYAMMASDPFWVEFGRRNPRLPLSVIPNGIDLQRLTLAAGGSAVQQRREKLGIPANAPIAGTIGRIVAERAPLSVLAGFMACARAAPTARFVFAGAGPLLGDVQAAGASGPLAGRLHTPGEVAAPAPLMTTFDLYVSVNVGSITGIAGLEAAALGVPVIALQMLADHVGGEDDWIWSHPDPEQLGSKMARLLADPAARAALAARQQAHVAAHLSAGTMAAAYEKLYAAAASKPE